MMKVWESPDLSLQCVWVVVEGVDRIVDIVFVCLERRISNQETASYICKGYSHTFNHLIASPCGIGHMAMKLSMAALSGSVAITTLIQSVIAV